MKYYIPIIILLMLVSCTNKETLLDNGVSIKYLKNGNGEVVENDEFIEIYVDCPLSVCEDRDTKGLYAKARQGIIKNFTGINDPYEAPEKAELVVDTDKLNLDESAELVIQYLKENNYLTL